MLDREVPYAAELSDDSVVLLADRLAGSATNPSRRAMREELRSRVKSALAGLSDTDQEVLLMRYLEDLSLREIAAVLEVSENAVKARHLRALDRLRRQLGDEHLEDPR